jgi:hypothetical protein
LVDFEEARTRGKDECQDYQANRQNDHDDRKAGISGVRIRVGVRANMPTLAHLAAHFTVHNFETCFPLTSRAPGLKLYHLAPQRKSILNPPTMQPKQHMPMQTIVRSGFM